MDNGTLLECFPETILEASRACSNRGKTTSTTKTTTAWDWGWGCADQKRRGKSDECDNVKDHLNVDFVQFIR